MYIYIYIYLHIFPFRSLLDRYSKVELLPILLAISFLTVSNAVVLECILRFFPFSNFTINVSCLHDLVFLVKATVWFKTKLLFLLRTLLSGVVLHVPWLLCNSSPFLCSLYIVRYIVSLLEVAFSYFCLYTDSSFCFLSLPSYC